MKPNEADELLALTRQLLECIAAGDWAAYEQLCDPQLTAFEPEAMGQLVEGLEFHRFYFEQLPDKGPSQVTMASPSVRILGDAAVVAYVRLTQSIARDGQPVTSCFEETRVWRRAAGGWRLMHFHRSKPTSSAT